MGTSLFFSIVDLHAVTVPQQASCLRAWKREALAALLAIGLDPQKSTVFYQSSVCFLWAQTIRDESSNSTN